MPGRPWRPARQGVAVRGCDSASLLALAVESLGGLGDDGGDDGRAGDVDGVAAGGRATDVIGFLLQRRHALTVGFSRAFLVAAAIGLVALLIAIATIRVGRQELASAAPEPQEAAPRPAASQPPAQQPGTEERYEDRTAVAAAARPCRLG